MAYCKDINHNFRTSGVGKEIELMAETRVLVTGAGGSIGSHLVEYLKGKGFWVRGADLKYPEFGETAADEF